MGLMRIGDGLSVATVTVDSVPFLAALCLHLNLHLLFCSSTLSEGKEGMRTSLFNICIIAEWEVAGLNPRLGRTLVICSKWTQRIQTDKF